MRTKSEDWNEVWRVLAGRRDRGRIPIRVKPEQQARWVCPLAETCLPCFLSLLFMCVWRSTWGRMGHQRGRFEYSPRSLLQFYQKDPNSLLITLHLLKLSWRTRSWLFHCRKTFNYKIPCTGNLSFARSSTTQGNTAQRKCGHAPTSMPRTGVELEIRLKPHTAT